MVLNAKSPQRLLFSLDLDSHQGPASDAEMGSEKHASSCGATAGILPKTDLPVDSGVQMPSVC